MNQLHVPWSTVQLSAASLGVGCVRDGVGGFASGSASTSSVAVRRPSTVVSAAIGASAVVKEKASILSRAAMSTSPTESASAGSETPTSAVRDKEGSAALVTASAGVTISLYVRYARESSRIDSRTISVDIDAASQEIQLGCTDASSDEAVLVSATAETIEQHYRVR